jgi:outer membrane protein
MQKSTARSLFSNLAAAPLLVAAALPLSASADVIGGEVTVSYWGAGYGGDVTDRASQDTIDLEKDLKLDDGGFVEFTAAIEHPVPILPNVKIRHIDLDETADGSITADFNGISFNSDVTTNLDLTHSSAVLYYEVLDNIVSLDLGLEARMFDGQLRIEEKGGTNEVSETKIDETLPLAYVAASVGLPLTGLSVGAEVSGISYSGDKIMDAKAAVRYNIGLFLVEAGYRSMNIKVNDISGIDVDADLSGAYLTTGIDF